MEVMSKPSLIRERYKRQAAELLAIIQTGPQVSTVDLMARTGLTRHVVKKRLTALRDEGRIIMNHDQDRSVSAILPDVQQARPLSSSPLEGRVRALEKRVSVIEQALLKHWP
jgi:biotin operon repressor